MVKTFFEKLASEYIESKALAIDRELFKFLRENGVTESTNHAEIVSELKRKNLELITEIKKTEVHEIYFFKLCKVYNSHSFLVPLPSVKIND